MPDSDRDVGRRVPIGEAIALDVLDCLPVAGLPELPKPRIAGYHFAGFHWGLVALHLRRFA
ncbi:MAG: hypothetical protein [Olavius algarvensis Gamma 1 endosymbiont]|nr:MAG: hypothetical protein [Olavius algarvensis Gamma 1 endosymbiont]